MTNVTFITILFVVFFVETCMAMNEQSDISSQVLSLAKSNQLIDKTDLISEFINSKPVVMLRAPPRFGKSINMELIKKFCEVPVDVNGTRIPAEETENYKFFRDNNLNIYTKNITFFNTHFANYPVIHLDFNKFNTTDYKSFIQSLKRLVMEVFASHKYLLTSTRLTKWQKNRFNEFYVGKNFRKLEESLFDSIGILTTLVFINFEEKLKSMILIDGYDAPIQKSFFQSNNVIYTLIKGIYNIMKFSVQSNPFVRRTLINNCITQKKILPTSLFNIKFLRFLNSSYSPYYGFTEGEVITLLEKNHITDKLDDVRKWYGGYRIKNSSTIIYNPLSVTKYVQSKQLKNFWGESVYVENIKTICTQKPIKDKIQEVLSKSFTRIKYIRKLSTKTHVPRLKEILENDEDFEFSKEDVDLFMQFLTDRGYFVILSKDLMHDVRIAIPNEEAMQEIKRFIV